MAVLPASAPAYTVFDLGYDRALSRALYDLQGAPPPPELANAFSAGTAARTVLAGELISSLEQQTGAVFSGKTAFSNSVAGYRLGVDTDGLAKLYIGNSTSYLNWTGTALNLAGALSAVTIDIGGADATSFHVDIDGNMWLGAATFAAAPAKVSNAGAATFTDITATGGTVGGFTLAATTLTATNFTLDAGNQKITLGSANNIVTLDAADADYRIAVGHATYASAPFRVKKDGTATMTQCIISGLQAGSSLDLQYALANSIGSAAANLALRDFTTTTAFASDSATQVSWGAGTLTLSDGTAYSIGAGNTGTMSSRTYIYLDIAVSTTAYQVTTTAATAVGNGKKLVATAVNVATGAEFQVFGGIGGIFVGADQIASNSITANKLSVSQLSAVAADLGAITAGTITLTASGNIKSGQTDYNTGTGFWLGISSGTAKFSIGDGGTSNYLTWDGSDLVINGYVQNTQGTFGGDGSDGALSISSGTTTIDCASANVVVKNYTSISITGTGKLAFSNPATGGTVIILKSKSGGVTITSSTNPAIDLRGIGAAGGASVAVNTAGLVGTNTFGIIFDTANHYGGGGAIGATGGTAGAAYSPVGMYATSNAAIEATKSIFLTPGSGGGSGGGASMGAGPLTSGAGGRGGGALLIECNGAYNCTGTINASGNTGGNASCAVGNSAGGGGGGGGGMIVVLYKTLTADSGTYTVAGGTGGNQDNQAGVGTGAGGGGGGGVLGNAGTVGGSGGSGGASGNGGAGGAGSALRLVNRVFA